MSGIPGSGKSTLVRHEMEDRVSQGLESYRFSADDYFVIHQTGEYKFNRERLAEAHAWCFRGYLERVSEIHRDCNIYVDNTNIDAWEISPYILAANAYGVSATVVSIHVSVETALARQTHGVPAKNIRAAYARLQRRVTPARWDVRVVDND